MKKLKISPALLTGVAVAVLAIAAFLLRVCFSHSQIFKGDWIKYASADAYFHMRMVDITANNFPSLSSYDPYLLFPGGGTAGSANMFVRVMAGVSSLFGIVSPSQHTIDVVGVFTPPVLAALTVVAVFFLGKAIFGKWGGLLSAAMLTVLPGEWLSRTKLGFTDYHCMEIFLTTLFVLFVVLALKAARNNELSFSHLLKRNWAALRSPVIYSVIAGLVFTLYALTWRGAPLFIFIVFVCLIAQFVIDHLRKRSTDYLSIVSVFTFLPALVLLLPSSVGTIVTSSLAIAVLAGIVIGAISRFMTARQMKVTYFPAALVVLAGVGFGLFYLIFRSVASSMLQTFAIFSPAGTQLTTIEMQPLISSTYGNPLTVVMNNYNITFFLAIISLAILVYVVLKKGDYGKTFLLIWGATMLIANLAQRRFGYYYGVNVALLVGYLAWIVLDFARSRIFTEKLKHAIARAKEAKNKALRRKQQGPSVTVPYVVMSFTVVIVFFVAYFWSIEPAINAAGQIPYAPSDAWCTSLDWMRENTPEPFEDPDKYYELVDSEEYRAYSEILLAHPDETGDPLFYTGLDEYYPYPESAYGVLSWWDYGYWITRIARRIPNANPSQDPRAIEDVAAFFTAQQENPANEVMDRLDSDYIIVDYETAYVDPNTAGGKFWAVITWSGQEVEEFFDLYLVSDSQDSTRLVQRPLFYPEYYKSMAVRLYNFDCQAVTPAAVWVIKWEERQDDAGHTFKLVADAQQLPSYEEAEEFIASQETGNYRIVSGDPMVPCVPLEALDNYTLEYGSPQGFQLTSANTSKITPEVKIFKYTE